jgi:ribosome-binding protein aMBF1 (putative translation factor)
MRNKGTAVAGMLTIRGVEYVVIPKSEYLRVQDSAREGTVDAHAFVRESIAGDLRAAREHAKLTQENLAKRMGKSQTLVSQAEAGIARISERYVRAVLKACRLPADWSGPKAKARRRGKKS